MREKEKRIPVDQKLVDIRKSQEIKKIWEECCKEGLVGRTYASRIGKENPFYGSNITFGTKEKGIVVINQDPEGEIQVHGFSYDPNNEFAQKIKDLFREK